jgi:excisionase family DNA binding protein
MSEEAQVQQHKRVRPRLPRLTYGIKEVAESLGVSEAFIRLEIDRKHLQVIRAGRRVLVIKSSFDEYIANA